jgi:hypothetical protein
MNKIQIDKLVENHGQIHGLPSNPRTISDEKFQKLKQSLIDDPEMLESRPLLVYPYGGENVVIGGNMRLLAAKALNMESIPCYIFPEETPIEKIRAIVIKDNLGYGDWDWSLIFADWDLEELSSWGMDLPKEWNADPDDFSDVFSLKDGGKDPFQYVSFILADIQAEYVKKAISDIKETEEFKYTETFGNENSNGNALYLIITQWAEQRK